MQFNTLALSPVLLETIAQLGFKQMTDVQAQSLPLILDQQDVIAQAKTGSGKTLAFALGVLSKLNVSSMHVQGLVLCPTRELADQVATEIRKLASGTANVKILTLCGGVPIGPQISSLEHGAHIIVGTPGRIEDHLFKGTLDLTQVNTLVLDEADQMLDMGFTDAIENIVAYLPPERQSLLFSATYPKNIESLSAQLMRNPQQVKVEEVGINKSIKQTFYKLSNNKLRFNTLRLLLMKHQPKSCVVFCNTKVEAKRLFEELKEAGFYASALHGDLAQQERAMMLMRFANK
ncbi:MAG: DEAD/DEAH box helicase, partial [Pseudomonadota bacterium]